MEFSALAVLLGSIQNAVPLEPIAARLVPRSPQDGHGLRWSPKGATVKLESTNESLSGSFELGPQGTPRIRVRLEKTSGAAHFDVLQIDIDRDGKLSEGERFTTKPSEQRGKWWSSFEATLSIPVPADETGEVPAPREYPVSLWFVEDPQEPDAKPALRWSRRGWHEGEVQIGGKAAFVLITEMEMDGVFDQRDCWAIARDRESLLRSDGRGLDDHVWLDGIAYRTVKLDPHGRSLSFEAFDPGISEADEAAKKDIYAPDRNAPRAEKPLVFGHDLDAALVDARRDKKRVLVDFETTWCGPCQVMNKLVYTSAPVVAAAKGVIAVKVDGDEHRDLVKQYAVSGYPTIVLLDAEGKEIRRAVGYRSVLEMVELLKP